MSEYVSETVTGAVKDSVNDVIRETLPLISTTRDSIFASMSDDVLALISPVISYWTFSGMFFILDHMKSAQRFKIHSLEEAEKRNRATKTHVLTHVLFQHMLQTAFGYLLIVTMDSTGTHHISQRPFYIAYAISFIKLAIAFLIIDTWQYWLHRLMHYDKRLYKNLHSVHHELYVPYAFGALFNSPLEGFLLDTLGTGIAMLITNLSAREQIILYNFATMKTVDDHCGYVLPWDPFQVLFKNNSIYHDIHHQPFGLKYNFAQPFFIFWDNLLDSNFKDFNIQDPNIQIPDNEKSFLKNKLDINKYHYFLKNRKSLKNKSKEEIEIEQEIESANSKKAN
ncbi:sphingosine hydroxylase NDAI_0C02160 [Naumovozyma dairenensis CBS 421]|uniref:Fatty acid hydroxylase domain-containing protein n=1 Tax=Naumovozyma dairenensis (strain ATCC 10597 / BCRC 20456 / CBS 421 / NBRC 0211 / NRRL Y-12639) TaxID=1071378 RepID=G0W7W5_NAUDC|nr:hypothetical protein NDAI_0C02160 [Naumovozyma dairenensis CBS 421]CCD23876.1 hypothetical protein NDAI_0C02160 [Naumovozyma dairenensis CBS 421]